jgi:hypothetical protein
MVAWATYPKDKVTAAAGKLELIETSPGVKRGHCARCGTSMTYEHVARPGEVDVTLASLGDPADLRPTAHIWMEDKVGWLEIDDGLPRYDRTASGA